MNLLPIFPLDLVLFPGAPLPLHIFEPRYKEMIADCIAQKMAFGVARAKESAVAEVGCTAVILNVAKQYDDGRMDIAAEGVRRFTIADLNHDRDFLQAEVAYFDDDEPLQARQTDQDTALQLHEQLFETLDQEYDLDASKPMLSFQLVNVLPVDLDFKQSMLEMKSEQERLETLIEYYRVTIPQVEKTIRTREKASGNGHVS